MTFLESNPSSSKRSFGGSSSSDIVKSTSVDHSCGSTSSEANGSKIEYNIITFYGNSTIQSGKYTIICKVFTRPQIKYIPPVISKFVAITVIIDPFDAPPTPLTIPSNISANLLSSYFGSFEIV